MTTVHGILIHGRYRYAAFYRLTDLPLPTTPRHLQEWRRLPLRHVEAKTWAKTARMERVGKLAPSRGQDCGLAPMDVATGVAGEAKIQKRRPRASRGRAKRPDRE